MPKYNIAHGTLALAKKASKGKPAAAAKVAAPAKGAKAAADRAALRAATRAAQLPPKATAKLAKAVADDIDAAAKAKPAKAPKAAAAKPAKGESKKAQAIALLTRKGGVSGKELSAALGWQAHTTRGFISTLGKTMTITTERTTEGGTVYRAA